MILASHQECRFCGNEHPPEELCKAVRVSRRSFLFALGATATAVALSQVPLPAAVTIPQRELYARITITGAQISGGSPGLAFVKAWQDEVDQLIRGIMRKTGVELAGDMELEEVRLLTGGVDKGKQLLDHRGKRLV